MSKSFLQLKNIVAFFVSKYVREKNDAEEEEEERKKEKAYCLFCGDLNGNNFKNISVVQWSSSSYHDENKETFCEM